MMEHIGYALGTAAKYVGRTPHTLQVWDRKRTLVAKRTKTNRRYYLRSQLDSFLGKTVVDVPKKTVVYCRVSSNNQRPDLKNQRAVLEDFCISKHVANAEFVEEIGGGLNFKRNKFLSVMRDVEDGKVGTLILAHKDRLARFGFDYLQQRCQEKGCSIICLNTEKLSPEQEMVQDLMTIIHCFSSRLYGLRNYRKSLKKILSK